MQGASKITQQVSAIGCTLCSVQTANFPLACYLGLLQSRFAGCREVSVEGLLRNDAAALEPRKRKQREWAKRQRFQNLDADSLAAELASKASISNGSGAAVRHETTFAGIMNLGPVLHIQ